jgi:ABC transport system ATP-binding/permease protein
MVNNFQQGTIVAPQPMLELNNHGQVLRFELAENVHRLGRDPDWADLKVRAQGWSILSRRQALLRREGDDYRIFDGDGETPSRNGLFYQHTRIPTVEGLLLQDGMQLEIGLVPETRILATYHGIPITLSRQITTIPGKLRLDLRHMQEWPVELGRAPTPNRYASMMLDAPMVSRLHARIYPHGKNQCLLQDVSTNGTFVNGQRIDRKHLLQNDDLIRIGPFKLLYRDQQLTLEDTGSQIRLDAHRLVKQVQDKQGRLKKILNDISLVIEPGQLVALVGGSGAGKSTLMKSLLGVVPSTSGVVFLNGDNLRQNWGIYRSQIGYVPQDDIIHANLTVAEVLTYACRLRLPPDTDVGATVSQTLSQIKLTHVRHTFVRNLSGGQRKRVSIGVELLADPKLFFLDEPTSGLDPGLDKAMMHLLRELAKQGRTVILVTHATANIGVCDRIVFLGRGGFLCYFGPPAKTLSFFDLSDPSTQDFSDIYLKLEQGDSEAETQQTIQYWAQKYEKSADYQQYITQSLTPGQPQSTVTKQRLKTGISPWQQLWLLSQRYLTLTLRDRFSQILTLVAGPIAIAFTGLILHQETPLAPLDPLEASQAPLALRLVFVFSCIAIWIGLSSAVREIVKEAPIYQRERLVNLGIFAYLGSKVLIWLGIALAQTVLMVVAIALAFAHPASSLMPWLLGLGVTNFLTVLASVCLSLGISAFVKTENAANSLLPLIMIPQIIFSGVLFDLEGMTQHLSWLMISRWSVGAYGSLIDVNSMVPDPVKLPDGSTLEQIFPPSPTYDATLANLGLNWGILGIHILVYLAISLWLQKRKDVI